MTAADKKRRQRAAAARDKAYSRAEDTREEALCEVLNEITERLRDVVHACFDALDRADRTYERALRRVRGTR